MNASTTQQMNDPGLRPVPGGVGASRQLAAYVAGADAAAIPSEVWTMARMLLLDQLGCQVAGVELPWSKHVFEALCPLSATGSSTVVRHEDRLAPDAAAFINSAFGHSNESDDTHLKSPTHPGAVVIPAAVAVAEQAGASGRELLAAIVLGYEVMLRVSYSVSPYLITRGHHPPPAVGPFGAAAACARLLGLDAEQTLNALAIAGSHSAGLQEYTQSGGSVKRLHCAIPSQAGVRSALLARAGVTGPPTVLEGERGFLKVFSSDSTPAWLTRGLGSEYVLPETSIKGYSCCHLIHPALQALTAIRNDHPFEPDDVEQILVYTQSEASIHHVGSIKSPADILGAQFSMSFSIAMLLTGHPCGWWDYNAVALDDPHLLALSDRTEMVLADAEHSTFVTGIRVLVRLASGETLEATVEHARGEPEDPMTPEEVRGKFESLAGPVLGSRRTAEAIAFVDGLDGASSLSGFRDAFV